MRSPFVKILLPSLYHLSKVEYGDSVVHRMSQPGKPLSADERLLGGAMGTARINQREIAYEDLQLLTLSQVAKLLQVSISDVRRKVRAGVLPHVRLGPRQVRVLVSDLKTYIEKRRRPLRSPDDG